MNVFSSIRARLRNAHPDHHAIARGMAWVALFVLLGSFARAAKEVAIAYRYGVSAEVDAYLFVFNLVNWPVGIWFSVLTVVLVPLVARSRRQAPEQLVRFNAELLGATLCVGAALTVLAWLGLPLLLSSSVTGLPLATTALAVNMLPAMLLLMPLGLFIGLLSAWMLACGRHTNTLLESVPAMVILIALWMLPGAGVDALVWGTLAGFGLHAVSLLAPLMKDGEVHAPRIGRLSPQWPLFFQGFGLVLAAQAVMSLVVLVDQFFSAHLGTGTVATLSYANRILGLILGVGATAVSRATLPIFSNARTQRDEQLQRVAMHWVRLLFSLGTVAMVLAWFLAPWGVGVLFERGAFTAHDTQSVTEVFRFGLAQLPFYFAGLVYVSLLTSQGKYRVLVAVGILNLVVKLISNMVLVPIFGVNGLMLATSMMLAVSCFTLGFLNVNQS